MHHQRIKIALFIYRVSIELRQNMSSTFSLEFYQWFLLWPRSSLFFPLSVCSIYSQEISACSFSKILFTLAVHHVPTLGMMIKKDGGKYCKKSNCTFFILFFSYQYIPTNDSRDSCNKKWRCSCLLAWFLKGPLYDLCQWLQCQAAVFWICERKLSCNIFHMKDSVFR